jgi:hypothetical protein
MYAAFPGLHVRSDVLVHDDTVSLPHALQSQVRQRRNVRLAMRERKECHQHCLRRLQSDGDSAVQVSAPAVIGPAVIAPRHSCAGRAISPQQT